MTLRYFGQPKYLNADPVTLIGYELLLRESDGDGWRLPLDFDQFSADTLSALLRQTLAAMPKDLPLISFNLTQKQFVSPCFIKSLVALEDECRMHLFVELTEDAESVPLCDLARAAESYAQAGIQVVIDDVGSGANDLALVDALRPYTSEYKFAL